MRPSSLSLRIALGGLLWTIGLVAIAALSLHIAQAHLPRPLSGRWSVGLTLAVAGLAAVSMLVGFLQVRRGLSPINRLRDRLAAVRSGSAARVTGSYPAEVQPLVDDLNALLEEREQRLARAVAKAGDLAHGLKTPLAVLTHDGQQVRAAGHGELAADIEQQIERMRRQVEYHLAHARSTAASVSKTARAAVATSADALVRTLQRLHAERGVQVEVEVEPGHHFRGQSADLDEMLGNLLDNACKWARGRVRMTSDISGETLRITIDDDGPGIDAAMRETVLQRGVRLDETPHGSGLGLAIVRELADTYGGSIRLELSPFRGLRAVLTLPGCQRS